MQLPLSLKKKLSSQILGDVMAALLRKYCHRYFIVNKRYASNDKNQKNVATLETILSKLKNISKESTGLEHKQSMHGKTDIFYASTLNKQKQTQTQPKPSKQITPIQKPLPIPTKLDLSHEPDIQPLPQPQPQQPEQEQDNIYNEIQQRIESELQFEPGTERNIRPFPTTPEKTEQIEKKQQESQRLKKKSTNKTKYKEFAQEVTDSKKTIDITEIHININDNISQWIYDKILQYKGQELPTPQDIMINFPSISIQTAKDIRENVINQLIENTAPAPSLNNVFSTFNPQETDSSRDPFDFSLHSKHEFDGIEEFDPDFHANGINLNGLNPASWYGYNNIAYDDYFNCHEPNLQEVESEYGKFRCLLSRNNKLDINMILDLRRKIYKIDNDVKTITFGLTCKNRKEFVGNNMDLNMISLIPDNACLYFTNLFYLIDDIIHLNKPFVIATSGALYNVQSSIFLAASTRLADSSVRIIFDNCLYGQVPFGGAHYFNCINQKKQNKHQLFWNLLSNEAMSCYNAHELGMVDWVMPSPNNVLFFNHFGNEIDKTFNVNFNEQDRFRHRAKIKSIIELFDRGIEYYTNKNNDTLLLDAIFSGSGSDGGGIDKIINRIEQISTGDFDFALFVGDENNETNRKIIKNLIHKAKGAMDNIYRSSPLALYLSYIIYYGSMKQYEDIVIHSRKQENIGTHFFRSLLSYEYNAMCWLMYFGDFWEGIKYKNDNNYVPKWKWSSMDKLLTSKDINSLISQENKIEDVLQNSIIFNELPYSWMKSLNFSDVNLGVDDDSITSKVDIINKKNSSRYYLSDYSMLRGSVAPNIQLKLSY